MSGPLTEPTDSMVAHRAEMEKFFNEQRGQLEELVGTDPTGILFVSGNDVEQYESESDILNFGRKVSSKITHDSIECWTHARHVVVVDTDRLDVVPHDVIKKPTDERYDLWINRFSSDYEGIGKDVKRLLLNPHRLGCDNLPYVIICAS